MNSAKIRAILNVMRIPQWVKNTFIFLPAFFGEEIIRNHNYFNTLFAFIGFSLIASSVYILNDYKDLTQDQLHPDKKNRPLASGELQLKEAALEGVLLLTSGFLFLWFTLHNLQVIYIMLGYVLLNIAYTFILKHFAVIDVITIAFGFVIRLFVGSSVTAVVLSQWIIITTFLLALFLALSKRRDDVLIFIETNDKTRTNISGYNLEFLNASIIITAAVIIVTYLMYTLSPEVFLRTGVQPYPTAAFVLAALLRYLQLTFVKKKSGNPTKILLTDFFLQAIILAWIISFVYILYIK